MSALSFTLVGFLLTPKWTAQPLAHLRGGEYQCNENTRDRNDNTDEGENIFLGPRRLGCVRLRALCSIRLRWRGWYCLNRKAIDEKDEDEAEA
jgi:hypothetical protein